MCSVTALKFVEIRLSSWCPLQRTRINDKTSVLHARSWDARRGPPERKPGSWGGGRSWNGDTVALSPRSCLNTLSETWRDSQEARWPPGRVPTGPRRDGAVTGHGDKDEDRDEVRHGDTPQRVTRYTIGTLPECGWHLLRVATSPAIRSRSGGSRSPSVLPALQRPAARRDGDHGGLQEGAGKRALPRSGLQQTHGPGDADPGPVVPGLRTHEAVRGNTHTRVV